MMPPADDELERLRLEPGQLAAYEAPPAPLSLMDRVMNACAREDASRRPAMRHQPFRRLIPAGLVAAAGLALIAGGMLHWRALAEKKLEVRTSVPLGGRAIEMPSGFPNDDMVRLFGLGQAELLERARRCHIVWDFPPLDGSVASPLDDAGLSADEFAVAQRVHQVFLDRTTTTLRKLYGEIVGDPNGAEQLAAPALMMAIQNRTTHEEMAPILERLSQERALLVLPPGDVSGRAALERYFRFVTSLGDEYEEALATVVGADRARLMRVAHDGWLGKFAMAGCPER